MVAAAGSDSRRPDQAAAAAEKPPAGECSPAQRPPRGLRTERAALPRPDPAAARLLGTAARPQSAGSGRDRRGPESMHETPCIQGVEYVKERFIDEIL